MPAAGASVLIVDDHPFFRAGLRSLLCLQEGSTAIWVAAAGVASGSSSPSSLCRRITSVEHSISMCLDVRRPPGLAPPCGFRGGSPVSTRSGGSPCTTRRRMVRTVGRETRPTGVCSTGAVGRSLRTRPTSAASSTAPTTPPRAGGSRVELDLCEPSRCAHRSPQRNERVASISWRPSCPVVRPMEKNRFGRRGRDTQPLKTCIPGPGTLSRCSTPIARRRRAECRH
jgi:hypothetical protein